MWLQSWWKDYVFGDWKTVIIRYEEAFKFVSFISCSLARSSIGYSSRKASKNIANRACNFVNWIYRCSDGTYINKTTRLVI